MRKNNFKNILVGTLAATVFLLQAGFASAHVVVKPNEVGAAAFQTFSVGVPVEKSSPTTSVRLVIPEGLKNVSPNVKPGWNIEVKKQGEGEAAVVTEINWSGGEIPSGQRDDFVFSAQAPADATTLVWKAYQTYQDGEVVAWDQKPGADNHDASVKPYSETKVVKDLAATSDSHHETGSSAGTSQENLPMILSSAAIIMAGGSLYLQTRKKK